MCLDCVIPEEWGAQEFIFVIWPCFSQTHKQFKLNIRNKEFVFELIKLY